MHFEMFRLQEPRLSTSLPFKSSCRNGLCSVDNVPCDKCIWTARTEVSFLFEDSLTHVLEISWQGNPIPHITVFFKKTLSLQAD